MKRELTPVEARSGVISGRIFRILVISTTAAALALGLVWVVVY
jgi:NADH:ubiquinone oxidoreductase subunit K